MLGIRLWLTHMGRLGSRFSRPAVRTRDSQRLPKKFQQTLYNELGTRKHPAPTLGLERDPSSHCIGTAFYFPTTPESTMRAFLASREGTDFIIELLDITLPSGDIVKALTPLNKIDAPTYCGGMPLRERASMAILANGVKGSCFDYVKNLNDKLSELKINDPFVQEFWNQVHNLRGSTR